MKGKELKKITSYVNENTEVVFKIKGEEVFINSYSSDFLETKLEIELKPIADRKVIVVEGVK